MHTYNKSWMLNKNDVFVGVLLIFYWVGVLFYRTIDEVYNFTFIDEIIILCLFCTAIVYRVIKHKRLKPITVICSLLLIFYLLYSLRLGITSKNAIFGDFVIVAKPFIAVLATLELNPKLNQKHLTLIKYSVILGTIILILVPAIGGNDGILLIFGHTANFATAATATAIMYLCFCPIKLASLTKYLFILSVGLISMRSKAYGFFAFSFLFTIIYGQAILNKAKISFNIKVIITLLLATTLAITVSYEKIAFYFFKGIENEDNMFARPALYLTSLQLLKDYFPFGAGFGTFGSYYSGLIYSPLYGNYGISHLYGLTETHFSFVADTFFPQILGQFGLFGLLMFLGTGVMIFIKAQKKIKHTTLYNREAFIVYSILVFFVIESTVDSTLVQNRGSFILILATLMYNKIHHDNTS